MEGVRGSDLRAVLEFVEFAWANACEHAFPLETVEALGRLIPCDVVGYCELDRINGRTLTYAGNDESDNDSELFWSIVREHPLCRHQQAYGDFSVKRLSDVVSAREFARSRVYAEWFRPWGIAAEMEVGISESRTLTRTFVLDRVSGDFSQRDVAVLELVMPHLARIHEATQLRAVAIRAAPTPVDLLTQRETEVLELVSAGLANAQIAERLWVSPGTVKKHLDNIYAKLGVGNRTAAVAVAGGLPYPKAQPEK